MLFGFYAIVDVMGHQLCFHYPENWVKTTYCNTKRNRLNFIKFLTCCYFCFLMK